MKEGHFGVCAQFEKCFAIDLTAINSSEDETRGRENQSWDIAKSVCQRAEDVGGQRVQKCLKT